MTELNIVDLIENNPLTKLSTAYQSKLLIKIKDTFNDHEQQLFVASFYCYLSYNPKTDFVIDLDNVWEWMGFSKKTHAKYALKRFLSLDNDYKIFAAEDSAAKTGRGGHNKIRTMLTVKADGFYHIDMIKYKKCFGTREEVWCGDAFKTTGGLKKTDLILNKSGDIVSKKKFITEKSKNRFIMTA